MRDTGWLRRNRLEVVGAVLAALAIAAVTCGDQTRKP